MKKHLLLLLISLVLSASANAEVYNFRHAVPGITIPPPPDMTNDVACGHGHCYAVVNSEVWSIGVNTNGQLGIGNNINQKEWVKTGLTGVSSVATGNLTGYAIKGGTVWSVGSDSHGQLGRVGDVTTWQPTSLSGASKVVAGRFHAYALKGNEVWAVGYNAHGQLGDGTKTNQLSWVKSNITDVSKIVAGFTVGYAIKNGELYVVGMNYNGSLGTGSTSSVNNWTGLGITGVTDIAAGVNAGYIIKNGQIMTTGANSYGELGNGSSGNNVTSWTGINFHGVNKIYANPYSSTAYAIKDGELYGVGWNYSSNIGNGDSRDKNVFTKSNITGAVSVVSSFYHAFAFTQDGVFSSGNNEHGLLSRPVKPSNRFEEAINFPINLKKQTDK